MRSPIRRPALAHAAINCLPSCAGDFRVENSPGSAGAASSTLVNCSVRPVSPRFGEHPARRADFAVEMADKRQRAALAQPPRALLDDVAGDLRHARRRRSRPRRERKDVQVRQAAFVDQLERASNMRPRSRSGKPAIRSAPNTMSGRRRRTCSQKAMASRAQVPPLHALEDEIVAGLQRQVQMRHQPLVLGEGVEQIAVGLDRIDRGQPQPLELGHLLENLPAPACRAWARPADRRHSS